MSYAARQALRCASAFLILATFVMAGVWCLDRYFFGFNTPGLF